MEQNTILHWTLYRNQHKKAFELIEAIDPLAKKFGARYGTEGDNKINLLDRPNILGMIQVIERRDQKIYNESKEGNQDEVTLPSFILNALAVGPLPDSIDTHPRFNDIERLIRSLPGTDLKNLSDNEIIKHWLIEREELHAFYVVVLYFLFTYYNFEDTNDTFADMIHSLNNDLTEYAEHCETLENQVLLKKEDAGVTAIYEHFYTQESVPCRADIRTNEWRNIIGMILSQVGAVN